jgi:hypothetical protein
MNRPSISGLLAVILALALASTALAAVVIGVEKGHPVAGRDRVKRKPAADSRDVKPVGWTPLSSATAAQLVRYSNWEPRPHNYTANHTVPSRAQLAAWRALSEMPYADLVDGRFTGTTDEIIQWAAIKWGLPVEVLRAVAALETWWDQSFVGDDGDSYGIFQVRRPYHCFDDCAIARDSTAFAADYYGGIIRAYYDGKMTWLNREPHGRKYAGGDLWGSVGAWFSGRWWTAPAAGYISQVQQRLAERTWAQPGF